MGRAFGFDGDSAYSESLEAYVLAQEAEKKARRESEASERRASLGLPREETKSRKQRKAEKEELEGKKSFGEKVANFLFNVNRSKKSEIKHRQPVGPAHVGPVESGTVTVLEEENDVTTR